MRNNPFHACWRSKWGHNNIEIEVEERQYNYWWFPFLQNTMVFIEDILDNYRATTFFKLLNETGFTKSRISGSHHIFTKDGERCIPVPVHNHEIRPNIARILLRQAGLLPLSYYKDPLNDSKQISLDVPEVVTEKKLRCMNMSSFEDSKVKLGRRQELKRDEDEKASERAYQLHLLDKEKLDEAEQKASAKLTEDRMMKLENIYDLFANFEFLVALDFLEIWVVEIHDIGTSDVNYAWAMDISFCQVFARTENALTQCSFSSIEQHKAITLATIEAEAVLAHFVSHRKENSAYILSTQKRIYGEYFKMILVKTKELFTAFTGSNDSFEMAIKISRDNFKLPDGHEIICGQLQTLIAQAVRFIMELKRKASPSLVAGTLLDSGQKTVFLCCIDYVVREMLCLFDFNKLEEVKSYSNVLINVIKELNDPIIKTAVSILRPIISYLPVSVQNHLVVDPISDLKASVDFVDALLESAIFGRDHFSMKRTGGIINVISEENDNESCCDWAAFPLPFSSLSIYMGHFLDAMKLVFQNPSNYRRNVCALFVVQSLYDPYFIIKAQLTKLCYKNDTLRVAIGNYKKEMMKAIGLNQHLNTLAYVGMNSNALSIFDHPQFDGLRIEVIKMLLWLDTLHEYFVLLTLSGTDLSVDKRSLTNNHHDDVNYMRLNSLPMLRVELNNYINLILHPFVKTVTPSKVIVQMLLAISVIGVDLDLEANWDVRTRAGERCSMCSVDDSHEKARMIAVNHWSFSFSIRTWIPAFLVSFLYESEINDVEALVKMQKGEAQNLYYAYRNTKNAISQQFIMEVFSLLYSLCGKKLTISAEEIGKAFGVSNKHDKKWIMNNKMKYSKLIMRLLESVKDYPDAPLLLKDRDNAVKGIMGALKDSILPLTQISDGTLKLINSADKEALMLADPYIKRFSWSEINMLRERLMNLDRIIESITRHMSIVFGGELPIFHSILSIGSFHNKVISIDMTTKLKNLKEILKELVRNTL